MISGEGLLANFKVLFLPYERIHLYRTNSIVEMENKYDHYKR